MLERDRLAVVHGQPQPTMAHGGQALSTMVGPPPNKVGHQGLTLASHDRQLATMVGHDGRLPALHGLPWSSISDRGRQRSTVIDSACIIFLLSLLFIFLLLNLSPYASSLCLIPSSITPLTSCPRIISLMEYVSHRAIIVSLRCRLQSYQQVPPTLDLLAFPFLFIVSTLLV